MLVFNEETGEWDRVPDSDESSPVETEEDRVKRELLEKAKSKGIVVSLPEAQKRGVSDSSSLPTRADQDKDSKPSAGCGAQADHKRELNRKRVRKYRLEHGEDFKTYHANYMKNYRSKKKEGK